MIPRTQLPLDRISILEAYTNLIVAYNRFRGTNSTARHGEGLPDEEEYFPHVEKPQ